MMLSAQPAEEKLKNKTKADAVIARRWCVAPEYMPVYTALYGFLHRLFVLVIGKLNGIEA